jgi:hypothetical protein
MDEATGADALVNERLEVDRLGPEEAQRVRREAQAKAAMVIGKIEEERTLAAADIDDLPDDERKTLGVLSGVLRTV